MHTYANQADDVREMVEMVITRLVRCDRVLHHVITSDVIECSIM